MANAKVAWQGWNSSNIAWDESTWGDAEEAITGLTATLGSVTVSAAAGVTASGNAATSGLGSVTVTGVANVTATGIAITAELGTATVWGNLIPDQTPSWSATTPSQSPSWSEVTPSQTPDWTDIAA